MRRLQRGGQQLGHVFRMNRREMLELVTATRTGRNDNRAGRLGGHLLQERGRNFQEEIVFSVERPESDVQIPVYSVRNASMGFTMLARRAGR
jgi:hypothetical protein